ncbi:MATE family efflux transporter [Pseudomonadales bacterium]|nr:MATE family efflux transporter [Pseudomonadales bacterium]MDB2449162.1 MATE family efflux transporter [Pseudomonadales bacterium]MDC1083227.1 MATE family efflux transporter [Pseudomonadales bacterium]
MSRSGLSRPATYTEGAIRDHVAKLSSVMILGFLAMTVGQLIEIFYIGKVGKAELAAVTFMFPISMSLNALTRGIGIGAATLIAQSMGAGDREQTAMTVTHCYILVLIFTIAVSLVGQFGASYLFILLGASDQVLVLATHYAKIWLIGFPMMGLAMVSNGLIRSFGNPTFPGFIMTIAPVVQVIVGPFLIFGWAGLPMLGLEGAAWAFVLGAIAQLLLAAYWYFLRERLFRLSNGRFLASFNKSAVGILQVGIPAAASNMIQPLSMGVVTWLLAGFGTTVVAAFGVASRIESVVGMVVIGISTSVVPLVGQNWGARKFERVHEALNTCYAACLIWGLLAATIMWFGAGYFVNFVNDDPGLVDVAVTFLHIIPFSIGFMGLIVVSTHAFNALRRPMPALFLSVARLLIVYIPLALLGSHFFGYIGVFAATAITNVLVGIVAVVWNRRTLSREQQLLSEA